MTFSLVHAVWKHPKARLGCILLILISLITLIGPFLVRDPLAYVGTPHLSPSWDYLFGTTGQGQDVLAQTVVGARPTLLIGFGVGIMVTVIGALIGVSAGFIGGRFDDLVSLGINLFLVIPGLPLAIILAAYLPSGPFTLAGVLTLTGWAWTARVLRAQTLTLRKRDFILAAQVAGESRLRIIVSEILPNLASLLLSTFVGTTVYAIGAQVGLEFLGLGDVGQVTWGTNLYWASNDQALLTQAWWTFVPTGLGVAGVGFALVLVNFGIDEITNPRLGVERAWRRYLMSRHIPVSEATPLLPFAQEANVHTSSLSQEKVSHDSSTQEEEPPS